MRPLEIVIERLGQIAEQLVGSLPSLKAGALGAIALAILSLALGLALLSVHEAARARRTVIARELPSAIDALALAVSAGLDFPGAIRHVVTTARDTDGPLIDELTRVLEQLALGQTRREALLALADRAPVPGVVELVQSMVHAEDNGSPVIDVLLVQAQASRMKRSARAEEAASRAGVAMMLPLFLLFGCTMIVVLGPILLNLR